MRAPGFIEMLAAHDAFAYSNRSDDDGTKRHGASTRSRPYAL